MSDNEIQSKDQKEISFATAIQRRYIETCIIPKEVLELPQSVGKQRTIELVGFEGFHKTFERLSIIDVSNMNISFCGNDCQPFKSILSRTKTLVLSRNLLTEWSEVAKIVANMESLSDIILSSNKLKLPKNEKLDLKSFGLIKTLVIDNIDYEWRHVLICSHMWPSIEELDVWGNKIVKLQSPEPQLFTRLQSLSLSNNDIKEWTEICKLGHLPNLKTLNVSNCNIREIRFSDTEVNKKTKLFLRLSSLLISNNLLSDWRDIAELNKLEKLDNLLIKNNPVFDNEKYETNFNLILSRIQNLKTLNKENITEGMRRDAQISYLRKIFKDYEKIQLNDKLLNLFMLSNPVFENILSKYGTPVGYNVTKSDLERNKFFNIKIQNPFDKYSFVEKKIPASISITNLKTIIRKLFDIDFDYDINLLWTSKNFECPLDKDSQSLNFYSIENGDTIVVNIQ